MDFPRGNDSLAEGRVREKKVGEQVGIGKHVVVENCINNSALFLAGQGDM